MLGIALAYTWFTFFAASRSLAACIANADTGLSGAAGGGCCAPAGWGENARASATPKPSKNPDKRFILTSPQIAALSPLNNTNSVGAGQHRDAGKTDEQPMFDDARNGAKRLRKTRRVRYAPEMGIHDPVAAIGDKNVTVAAVSDEYLARNAAIGKRFFDL